MSKLNGWYMPPPSTNHIQGTRQADTAPPQENPSSKCTMHRKTEYRYKEQAGQQCQGGAHLRDTSSGHSTATAEPELEMHHAPQNGIQVQRASGLAMPWRRAGGPRVPPYPLLLLRPLPRPCLRPPALAEKTFAKNSEIVFSPSSAPAPRLGRDKRYKCALCAQGCFYAFGFFFAIVFLGFGPWVVSGFPFAVWRVLFKMPVLLQFWRVSLSLARPATTPQSSH